MIKKKTRLLGAVLVFTLLALPGLGADNKRAPVGPDPVATMMVGAYSIDWLPKASAEALRLNVSGPEGFYWTKIFPKDTRPQFSVSDISGPCLDGQYVYELTALPFAQTRSRGEGEPESVQPAPPVLNQVGSFRVQGGSFLSMNLSEGPGRALDVVHADDVIITGSQCVGFDCLTDGTEDFGYDTIKLKENNLRLFFDDTSTSVGFPANDWRITANDSASGGANYFAIEDATNSKTPFKIEANAPTSSLYVDDNGNVGFGTATPGLELHILDGDTPSVRLDQDTSAGWTAQVWDLSGNESNFFIRDTTGSSKLPFRIQPGTPSNTLTMRSSGYVGIGTWLPESNLEIETTGSNNVLAVQRTDGATMKLSAMGASGQIGTTTAHAVNFMTNNVKRLSIAANSGYVGIDQTVPSYPLHMGSGAYCSVGGTWTNASSLAFKDNVQGLTPGAALRALEELRPVTFVYKADRREKHVGFIAEEVPELVASRDRKGLSPMDIVAVLTKVVQEQQKTIAEQQKALQDLGRRLQSLENRDN